MTLAVLRTSSMFALLVGLFRENPPLVKRVFLEPYLLNTYTESTATLTSMDLLNSYFISQTEKVLCAFHMEGVRNSSKRLKCCFRSIEKHEQLYCILNNNIDNKKGGFQQKL